MVAAYVPPPRDPADLVVLQGRWPTGGLPVSGEHVERLAIEGLLDRAAEYRICVVLGAAGWGKTTSVAMWSRGRSTGWLGYDDYKGDATHLLSSLAGALQAHVSVPMPIQGVEMDQVVSSVVDVCARLQEHLSKDLVLVLDDLHRLQPNNDAAWAIECLCRRAPHRLRLVLISRQELPFSLQRLRGRGLVTEIHAPDLAFDVADVEALLRKTVGKDPPGLSRQVWDYTAGWPAAVRCAVDMLRDVEVDHRLKTVEQLSHPGSQFHNYLAEEVIGAMPNWVQRLLHKLASLGHIKSVVETARGLNDPTTVLAELSRQGLVQRSAGWSLVRPLDDYFRHVAPSGGGRKALHLAAADAHLGRGAPADALRHLLAAGNYAACASLLVDHGSAIVESGQPDAVLQAAELPAEYLDDPRILRVLGQAEQVRGHWERALQHYQRAGHDRDELEPALCWRIGHIAFAQGEFDEVQALTQRARPDREGTLDEIRVLTLSASAYRMTGDLVSTRKVATRARAAARRCGHARAWGGVHHVFAMIAAAEGDWRQADAYSIEALRSAEACDDLLQLMWIRACRAFHQYERGAPRQALADAQVVLNLSERCEVPFLIAHALTTRGRACVRIGLLEEAVGDFVTAIDLFQRLGSRFLAWPLCGLGDLHRTRGQLVQAQAAYEEALTLAEPHHDVLGLSYALIGLARINASDELRLARELAARALQLGEGFSKVPAFLARGWVELMGDERSRALAYANRAAVAARQRQDNPGLAEAITLRALASSDPPVDVVPLREAVEIWRETGCRLEEAATRVVAARISAHLPSGDTHFAEHILRQYGVDVERQRAAGPLGVLASSSPAVFIQTLGEFQVTRDGAPLATTGSKSKKARELLKILVARRRPTSRDELIELLWPQADPAVASNRLSVLLSTVRDVLQPQPAGKDLLVTKDGVVSLNRAEVRIDVEDFLAQAATAAEADRTNEPDATAQLMAAVAAHTGDFLEDDPLQEEAAALVEEVRATYIALLRALSARLCHAGEIDAAVRYILRLLERDRYDEKAHLSLIEILLDAGRPDEARHHYQNYVRRMAEIDVPSHLLRSMTPHGLSRG